MARPKVSTFIANAKRAWETTAPIRAATGKVEEGVSNFETVLRQFESDSIITAQDDDLNKINALMTMMETDANRISNALGNKLTGKKGTDAMLTAEKSYGVNVFSVRASKEAVVRMDRDITKLNSYKNFAEGCIPLLTVITGVKLFGFKELASNMTSLVLADAIVVQDICHKCGLIKDSAEYGIRTLNIFLETGKDAIQVLEKIAPSG